ncbi:glycosyltransferase family 4 protein [Paraflavitalea sp. CAU 1676]|uniref:glycosyltransferase family 4 protein n=1 Tax=Paraflavitalea sp. CAU 1676 TaxID=3032598 RepID=UPI0023DC4A01|nr:glycosyltransferase family 4 protein [Paraflavitalea sp. CAU 1676]MDF2191487.1 glycosyltransferase family 4 protein [Paraflavitalea sp. CAU 1676]
MRIAILSPVTWRTPPRNYGPWEQVVSVLTEGLVKNGIDVTLFATGDSVTTAKLESVCPRPLGEYPADAKVCECLHISHLMEQAADFTLIHNHFDFLPLTWSRMVRTPFITTIHGFSSQQIIPVYKKYNENSFYVSISNSDRSPELHYLDTVYNGINEELFKPGQGNGDYLLYFGRIHPHKGAHEAINIARQANKPLVMAGLIQDEGYYQEKVAPFINGIDVIYKGNVGPEDRNKLLGNALALLHPISFEEPFGLSVVEAMMCGTPVIAFERGAMKELIVDGVHGFLVKDTAGAIAAVHKLQYIDREACRAHALANFSSQTMARRYIALYEKVSLHANGL